LVRARVLVFVFMFRVRDGCFSQQKDVFRVSG
jgi:hypothetical protein